MQRLYQNSMISPTTWANFEACLEEVKNEVEVIKSEADSLKEGWAESIVQESHWLYNHFQEEKKAGDAAKELQRARREAADKAKKEAAEKEASEAKAVLQKKIDSERATKELEREAEEAERKRGLTQRKGSTVAGACPKKVGK